MANTIEEVRTTAKERDYKANDSSYLLEVRNLKKYFSVNEGLLFGTKGYVKAVDGVTFGIQRGTTMGLVGESGCGKTTVGKTILRLNDKTDGDVIFDGISIFDLKKKSLRSIRP